MLIDYPLSFSCQLKLFWVFQFTYRMLTLFDLTGHMHYLVTEQNLLL